ncbi:MAG: GNAT family N-acetyltransferase [Chloroflexota bacterium]
MSTSLPPGFTTCPATIGDIPAAVDLFNDFTEYYLGIREATVGDIRNEWTSPGFEPENDIRLVFSPGGKLVGHIEVWTNANPPVQPWVWGRVHPDFEGQGLGMALLIWAEERARQAIPRCPADARVVMRTYISSSIESPRHLFEAQGLKLIRHSFRMLIEMDGAPPGPAWPEGIRIRIPNDPAAEIEAIYRADEEAFRDHFGYVEEPFEEGLARYRHHFLEIENFDPSLWFLAMDGVPQVDESEIAGICLCRQHSWEDPECGYVSNLAVRRPWRKRGIGLALLHHAFGEYYCRGFRKVALGVDAQNLTGALRLYEKAGMSVHRQYDLYEKELRPGRDLSVQ